MHAQSNYHDSKWRNGAINPLIAQRATCNNNTSAPHSISASKRVLIWVNVSQSVRIINAQRLLLISFANARVDATQRNPMFYFKPWETTFRRGWSKAFPSAASAAAFSAFSHPPEREFWFVRRLNFDARMYTRALIRRNNISAISGAKMEEREREPHA